MNPELADRFRRFGDAVEHAAIAAQARRAAPGGPAAAPRPGPDDTDDVPSVVPIVAGRTNRYRIVTAAAAAIVVVAAGVLVTARVTGQSDPGPAASTDVRAVDTTARAPSTTSSTNTTTTTTTATTSSSIGTTTVPVLPAGSASTPTPSSTTTAAGSGTSVTAPAASSVCPDGYHPYDHRYPIQLCDEGPAVALIQLHVGAPQNDGQFGPATRQSVRVFQAQHGLEVDGYVGLNTWTTMFPAGASGTDTDGSGIVDPWEVS